MAVGVLTVLTALPAFAAARPEYDGARLEHDAAATLADGWRRPVAEPVTVTRAFDLPVDPWRAGHRGVDFAAAPGSAVLAPRAGTVTFAGVVVDRAVLTIQHDDGLRSTVEPVLATVVAGSRVGSGDPVGTLTAGGHATTSCAPDSCVHWGVRRGEEYLDPMELVHPGPVVLLSSAPR